MKKLFFAVALLFASLAGCGPDMSVYDLQCEYLVNPLAIDNVTPHLSWKMISSEQDAGSTAYQILVASDPDKLNENEADLWNSGKVEDVNAVMAEYGGRALAAKAQAWWKVRVWNQNGELSKWSEPAFFGVGFIDEASWDETAVYIGIKDNEKSPEAAPLLRKKFSVRNKCSKMLLHVNSLGYHEAYVNGRPVSDAVLSPAVSEYDKRSIIVTYDVTSLLRKGENEILLWLGKGWYQTVADGVVPGGPFVRAQLDAVSDSEADAVVVTDGSWMAAESDRKSFGKWNYRNLGGEIVDSRRSLSDMSPESLDGIEWSPVLVADVPVHIASPQMCEPNRIKETIHPVSVRQVSDSCFVYDLGRTLTGFTGIRMPFVADGQKLELHYDDLYVEDVKNFRDGVYTDHFIGNGKSGSVFTNKFNYKAYRYLKIKGLTEPLPLEDITASAIRTDYKSIGSFECSDKDMNDIYNMVHRAMDALILGGDMVDCPHRERLGYGGDGNASTVTVQTIADLAPLYMNWLQAYADSQTEDGSMPHTAPNPYRAGGGPYWCMFIINASWQTYVNYGDSRMLERFYPNMQKWIEFAENNYDDKGLLRDWGVNEHRHWYLGDWAAPAGIDQRNPLSIDIVSNCVMSYSYGLMAKIASVLGKVRDAEEYARRKNSHNERIHDTFYDGNTSLYSTGTQIDMIYPMLVGATPEACLEDVRKALFRETENRFGGHLSAGLVGVPVITQWVTENGEAGFMYDMLKKRDYPGYLYMIDNGAYTTWEHWDGIKSQIHNCFNGIGSWFYQALAGICPDESHPGYRHMYIRPQPVEGIDWVKARKNTPFGELMIDWKRENGIFVLNVDIPAGSGATVCLPDGSNEVRLTSGTHTLSCKL